MSDPLQPPPAGRNPDSVFLLGFLAVAGLGQLASGAESGSVESLVPDWLLTAWALMLTTGAAVTFAGVMWRERLTGLLVEAAGRMMFGPSALIYAIALAVTAQGRGLLLVGLLTGLAASSAWRVWQVWRTLQRVRLTMRALARATDQHRPDRDHAPEDEEEHR